MLPHLFSLVFLSYPVSCCFYTSASQRQFSTLADDKDVFSSILRDQTQTQCVSLSCVSLTKLLSVIAWLVFVLFTWNQNRKAVLFRHHDMISWRLFTCCVVFYKPSFFYVQSYMTHKHTILILILTSNLVSLSLKISCFPYSLGQSCKNYISHNATVHSTFFFC